MKEQRPKQVLVSTFIMKLGAILVAVNLLVVLSVSPSTAESKRQVIEFMSQVIKLWISETIGGPTSLLYSR
jgi:hypothetical protein